MKAPLALCLSALLPGVSSAGTDFSREKGAEGARDIQLAAG